MKDASYVNYQHYIDSGWHKEPKRIFVFLADYLAGLAEQGRGNLLDVGCATGELIGYLKHRFPPMQMTGVDIFDPLLEEARRQLPAAQFVNRSALDLPGPFARKFDIVTAVGVIEIFDDDEARRFVENLMACCRPGGRVLLLSPFNEYGMDLNARHRKWSDGVAGKWESGNNVYAMETIRSYAGKERKVSFRPFDLGMNLRSQQDPQRTWTIEALGKKHQLMNGLKILFDLNLCIIEVE